MPSLTAPFGADGPIIEISVDVSAPRRDALKAAGMPVPAAVRARGIIDTGASCTCIDPSIIAQLDLSPTGTCDVHTSSSGSAGHICNLFDVALGIFMNAGQVHSAAFTLPVVEAELSFQGIDVLIGRDLLANATFFYNGPTGTFVLSF